jgi:hypothetical protein
VKSHTSRKQLTNRGGDTTINETKAAKEGGLDMPKKALTWTEFLDQIDKIMQAKNKKAKSAQQGDAENPPTVSEIQRKRKEGIDFC